MAGRIARPSKNIFMQVLWTGIDESIPCLFLFTDSKRYVFNCSEGLQRLFVENQVRIGKLSTFFFTQHRWSHLGGFPGFAMTLRDAKNATYNEQLSNKDGEKKKKKKGRVKKEKQVKAGIESLHIYGPDGMKNILDAASRFMKFQNSDMKLSFHEHAKKSESQIYEDVEMIVHSVPIYGSVGLMPSGVSLSSHRLLEPLSPSLSQSPQSLCYACHFKPLPGKFHVDKAKALGIRPGPMYGQLQFGETVTLKDGTQVKPSQVVDPDSPGVITLVVDCPDITYIESLTNNKTLLGYISKEKQANIIIHLSNNDVCRNEKYVKWMNSFPEETHHLFTKHLPKLQPSYKGQYGLQVRLNKVNSKLFPLIEPYILKPPFEFEEKKMLLNYSKVNLRKVLSRDMDFFDHSLAFAKASALENEAEPSEPDTLSETNISDGKNLTLEKVTDCSKTDVLSQTNNSSDFKNVDSVRCSGKRPLENNSVIPSKRPHLGVTTPSYPRVVCLGTGAAIPSRYRNVSATLVFLNEDNAFLLDCGEDTYGQLYRHYGDELDEILKKIKIILISHLHADHHLGLFTVLRNISKLVDFSVVVVGPYFYREWFERYGSTSELLQCQFVTCRQLQGGSWLCKDIHVLSVKVNHPATAFGFVVKNNKHSIVYSGDTTPCDNLTHAGRNCTLLIHEATLEDGMEEEAYKRLHSTTSQALSVAQNMNAKHLLLNHFSQRYPKIPRLHHENQISRQTVIAFDHMEISMEDIPSFTDILPKLQKLVEEEGRKDRERDECGGALDTS